MGKLAKSKQRLHGLGRRLARGGQAMHGPGEGMKQRGRDRERKKGRKGGMLEDTLQPGPSRGVTLLPITPASSCQMQLLQQEKAMVLQAAQVTCGSRTALQEATEGLAMPGMESSSCKDASRDSQIASSSSPTALWQPCPCKGLKSHHS